LSQNWPAKSFKFLSITDPIAYVSSYLAVPVRKLLYSLSLWGRVGVRRWRYGQRMETGSPI